MQQQHKDPVIPNKRKKSLLKRLFKWLLWVIGGIISLNILLYVLLSIPSVQQYLVDFAISKLKPKLNTEIKIDEVRLSLFNQVSLKGVYIEDQSRDTLLYAGNLDVRVSPLRLLDNELLINGVVLEDFIVKVSKKDPLDNFNFQFIIDAFSDTTKVEKDTTSSNFKIDIEDIALKNGRLRYDILSEQQTPRQFNASHIAIDDLNAELKLPSIDMANLDASLISMSFKEQSGFDVKNFTAHVTSQLSTMIVSNLRLDLNNSSLQIPSASYNLSTDEFVVNTEPSVISPTDVLPFMADLQYLKHNIELQTSIRGKLPFISIDNLVLNYGEQTTLNAEASISDFSRYANADINVGISLLRITPDAINDFAHLGDPAFVLPDILKAMDNVRLQGSLNGSFSNLNLKTEAWVKQGSVRLEAKGSVDSTFQNFTTKTNLHTRNFNLGALLKNPDLGRLSADISLVASQLGKQGLKAEARGKIENLLYSKQDFNNIPFTAYYNSAKMGITLDGDLPFGKIKAQADMSQTKIPDIDIDLSVADFRIDKFIDSLGWENPELTFDLKGHISGLDPNLMTGNLLVSNFIFARDSIVFRPGDFGLEMNATNPDNKLIKFTSSVMEAEINGQYNFITLVPEFSTLMNRYLPGIFELPFRKKQTVGVNNFNFNLTVNNTQDLSNALGLPFDIVRPILLAGNINTIAQKMSMIADIPYISLNDIDVKNTNVKIVSNDSVIEMKTNGVVLQDGTIYDLSVRALVASDTINTNITLKGDTTGLDIRGELDAFANFSTSSTGQMISSLQFKPTFLNIGKLNLSFLPATIVNEGDKTSISNFGFMVGRGRMMNRYLGIDGVISPNTEDTLHVSFFNAHLREIFQAFNINNVNAIADGDIRLTNLLNTPEFFTEDFSLSNIQIFGDTLGDLKLNSRLDDSFKAFLVEARLEKGEQTSFIRGKIDPLKDLLDLDINIDKFSVNWLQPFMVGILNHMSGSISSKLKATGKLSTPQVSGWLGVNDVRVGVDYTNVIYSISDTIQITPEKVGFDNLIIKDIDNNKATLSAIVTHKEFQDIRYSLDMNLNNLMVLNTANRIDSLFYGKVYTSGTVNIKGSDAGIDMNMRLRNGKNSSINVQIPQTTEASSYQGIVYINTPKPEGEDAVFVPIANNTVSDIPIKMEIDLTLTPDMQLGVVINSETGDAMQVKGAGLIKFTYDTQTEVMNTFGSYTISDGDVKLKLQNISTLAFKIQDGSKLTLNGNPMQSSFDITAYRTVNTNLATLSKSFEDGNNRSTNVEVDCVLGIDGDISKMNLTYDVSLPNAEEQIQQKVKNLINTNEKKIMQFAHLLVIGTFMPEGSSESSGNLADGLFTSIASSALSQGLNSIFGSVLGRKWQVGTNISSNDGSLENVDMSVSISRSFWDDKLEVSTNLGYRTDHSAGGNSLISDFDVAYALTRSIKVRAFNKTNSAYYKQALYTQGIGIVYTREAKVLKNLFQIIIKKRKRPVQESNNK